MAIKYYIFRMLSFFQIAREFAFACTLFACSLKEYSCNHKRNNKAERRAGNNLHRRMPDKFLEFFLG